MENGLMNSRMMGFTDVRGLNILEDAIAKFPNENYKDIDIQKSLDQYDLFRKETQFDEIYGDSDRTMDLGDNKVLHIFEGRKFELALFDSNDVAIGAATIFGGGFKTYLNENNSQMLIDILARQQIKNKLALYITDDYKYEISSKTGDKKGVENDTVLIHTNKGDFTFTVMSSDIPNSVYGTITLAKTGKMIWDNIMNKWS